MLLSYEVPDVPLDEFYIHSRNAINYLKLFKIFKLTSIVLLSRINGTFL